MPISPPPNQEPISAPSINSLSTRISDKWQEFFSATYTGILDLQSSGTTDNRPTKRLYVGRPFFDTSLGIPIWYNGVNWIDSSGGVV